LQKQQQQQQQQQQQHTVDETKIAVASNDLKLSFFPFSSLSPAGVFRNRRRVGLA